MSSPPKPPLSSFKSSPSKQATSSVHQKLSSVLGGSSGGSKPFIRNKSQTQSSIVFPSFRFSPESEEISEVLAPLDDEGDDRRSGTGGGEAEKNHGEASGGAAASTETPTSSSKSGGDVSPLKEYIKHKWTNKWDKRSSLSLDLDIKGKFFTAIEDKRRSFVSQFLNEDNEEIIMGEPNTPLTSSCSIPEQLVVGSSSAGGGDGDSRDDDFYCEEDVSVKSDSAVLFRHGSDRSSRASNSNTTKLNLMEENCTDYFDGFDDEYDICDLNPSDLKKNLIVEEIGIDCVDILEDIMGGGRILDGGDGTGSSSRSSLLAQFVLPGQSLQERFEGLPTLYQPPSNIMGLRKYPIQEAVSGGGGEVSAAADVDHAEFAAEEDPLYRTPVNRADYTVRGLIRNILLDIAYHPWVKYWIGVLAAVIIIDFGSVIGKFIWFMLGVGGTVICSRALWKSEWEEDVEGGEGSSTESLDLLNADGSPSSATSVGQQRRSGTSVGRVSGSDGRGDNGMMLIQNARMRRNSIGNGMKWRSQGWLLTLNTPDPKQTPYPAYNPFRNHLRDSKPVFARLNGPYLTLSVPHPRHRIPKRRLWSDPVINSEHIFIRHQQYDLTGAKVEIVPLGLAKKRVWCKKYPIGITIACEDKYCGELCSVLGGEKDSPVSGNADGENIDGKVSFSKDDKGNEKVKVASAVEKPKGEVFKDPGSSSGKVIYLFARCDREKDDWFRRLVAATRIKPPTTPRSSASSSDSTPLLPKSPHFADFSHFFMFMQRACPTMMIAPSLIAPISPRVTPTNDLLYENVSMHHISQQALDQSSQSSSRKSSPDNKLENFNFGPHEASINPSFLNALIARLFYDFLQSERWNAKVKKLIDRKLFFIRKPAMVQSLKVKSLDFGNSLPMINHASTPVLDSQGLWIDLDVGFAGCVTFALEAFINLMKMGSSWDDSRIKADLKAAERGRPNNNSNDDSPPNKSPSKHAMFDSEADDSGESSESSDDDVDLEELEAGRGTASTTTAHKQSTDNVNKSGAASTTNLNASGGRGKLLKYADSFAKSSVMRNKHVQKVVTGIATTPLILTVEIRRIVGSVAVNIPPVPNDRAWIGFRSNPIIDINVRPKVGQRVVSLTQITEWIKKKILLEFQRVMVCPNMIDVELSLMEFSIPK